MSVYDGCQLYNVYSLQVSHGKFLFPEADRTDLCYMESVYIYCNMYWPIVGFSNIIPSQRFHKFAKIFLTIKCFFHIYSTGFKPIIKPVFKVTNDNLFRFTWRYTNN